MTETPADQRPTAGRAVSAAARKQRAWRARARAGDAVLSLVLPIDSVADMLLDARLLGEWDADDRTAIQAALQKFIRRRCGGADVA